MRVLNIHERRLSLSLAETSFLIDSLASLNDMLWPRSSWPAMKIDGGLAIGAVGSHGPIKYFIENYIPGQYIRFRFTAPKGFDGYHAYEIIGTQKRSILRHSLKMQTSGSALLSWPFIFRPMHDALIEDSLAQAQAAVNEPPQIQKWSAWVKFLRFMFAKGKARAQIVQHEINSLGQ